MWRGWEAVPTPGAEGPCSAPCSANAPAPCGTVPALRQIWSFPAGIEVVKAEGREESFSFWDAFPHGESKIQHRLSQAEPHGILFVTVPSASWNCSVLGREHRVQAVVSSCFSISGTEFVPQTTGSSGHPTFPEVSIQELQPVIQPAEEDFILHPSSLILHPSSFILHPSSFIFHPSSFTELFSIPAQQDPADSLLSGLELAKSRQQLRVPVTTVPKLCRCRVNWPRHSRVLPATGVGLWNPKVSVCRPPDLGCGLPSLGMCGPQDLGLWNFGVMEPQVWV